jgi:glycogen(starch) synthase
MAGMKILVLSNLYPPDFVGGYELGCRQAVDALRGAGHAVRVLSAAPRHPVPAADHVRRCLHLADILTPGRPDRRHVVTRYLQQTAGRFVQAFNVHVLLAELEDFRPHVVYLWNLLGLGGLGLLACLNRLGVPWVWHLMDRIPRELCDLPGTPALAHLGRLAPRFFHGSYLACSERVVAEINEPGPLLDGEVELVPNWIEGSPPPPRRHFHDTGSRSEGTPLRIVSAAAHLFPAKGIDLLLEAAALLRRQGHRAFAIDLHGETTDDRYPRLIAEHGLGGCVSLRGRREQGELVGLYREYDLFAFPTWEREPFGFAPLEAAAGGCVPFITDDCGIGEWLVHGVHCWKVGRTVEEWAEALAAVLEGRIDLAPLGRRAEAAAWRDFHIGRALPRIERALQRAAGERRRPRRDASAAYRLAVRAERWAQTRVEEMLVG